MLERVGEGGRERNTSVLLHVLMHPWLLECAHSLGASGNVLTTRAAGQGRVCSILTSEAQLKSSLFVARGMFLSWPPHAVCALIPPGGHLAGPGKRVVPRPLEQRAPWGGGLCPRRLEGPGRPPSEYWLPPAEAEPRRAAETWGGGVSAQGRPNPQDGFPPPSQPAASARRERGWPGRSPLFFLPPPVLSGPPSSPETLLMIFKWPWLGEEVDWLGREFHTQSYPTGPRVNRTALWALGGRRPDKPRSIYFLWLCSGLCRQSFY